METHIIFTTHSAFNSAGASFEAAGLCAPVPARFERHSVAPIGLGFGGMILPRGDESAWPAFDAARLGSAGGLSLDTLIPRVGILFPTRRLRRTLTARPVSLAEGRPSR